MNVPHDICMLEALYTLYCEGNNCDLYLLTEDDTKLFVHSFVVGAAIPKIRDLILLSNNQQPSLDVPMEICGVTGNELKIIIDYAYLRTCRINSDRPKHVLNLLNAATYLGVTQLKRLCEQHLMKALDMMTSVELLESNAGNYPLLLHEMSEHFLLRNLTSQPCLETCRLSASCLLSLLSNSRLHAPYEEQAVELALRWIEYDPSARKMLLPQFFRVLRLGFLAPHNLNRLLHHPLVKENETALLLLELIKLSMHFYKEGEPASSSIPLALCPRLPHAIVLSVGGWNMKGETNQAECYDHIAERWMRVPVFNLPSRRTYFGIEQIDNFIYVIGGFGRTFIKSCIRLCLDTLKWTKISSMIEPRTFVATGVLHGEIYAVGGRVHENRLKTAEKYNPINDTWEKLPSLVAKRSDAGIGVLYGRLYVIGGFNGSSVLSTVEIYDPVIKTWKLGPPLSRPRGGHRCVVVEGHIYAIGGFDGNIRLNSVERFDPVTSSWSSMKPMIQCRSNFGVAVLDKRIFVLGGFCYTNFTNECEVYDCVEDCWYSIPSMPGERSAQSACVVDHMPLSQFVCDYYDDHQQVHLRDPNRQRPCYHPMLPIEPKLTTYTSDPYNNFDSHFFPNNYSQII